MHSGPENLKKSRQKFVKSDKSMIFLWNCIFGSFKLFPSSKIDFWPILKLQKKMDLEVKNFFVKLIYLISRVFLAWTFLNILAHCAANVDIFLALFIVNKIHWFLCSFYVFRRTFSGHKKSSKKKKKDDNFIFLHFI